MWSLGYFNDGAAVLVESHVVPSVPEKIRRKPDYMALWFATGERPTPTEVHRRRCVTPTPNSRFGQAVAKENNEVYSCVQNFETKTVYTPQGKRHVAGEHMLSPVETVLYYPDSRPTYTISPFEASGKKMVKPDHHQPREKTIHVKPLQEAPYALDPDYHHHQQRRSSTPNRADAPALLMHCGDGTQKKLLSKRHFDATGGAEDSTTGATPNKPGGGGGGNAASPRLTLLSHSEEVHAGASPPLSKRSRTPPPGTKMHCDTEGFCLLYNSRAAGGGMGGSGGGGMNALVDMKMVMPDRCGKNCYAFDETVARQREAVALKKDARWGQRCELARQRQLVERPEPKIEGKARGSVRPPVSGAMEAAKAAGETLTARPFLTPFATNLPSGPVDDVGRSSVVARRERGRSPVAGGGSETPTAHVSPAANTGAGRRVFTLRAPAWRI